jgi:glutamate racemase
MNSRTLACCIAATPVDTRFGARFLDTIGITSISTSLTATPEEQTQLQLLAPPLLQKRCADVFLSARTQGATFGVIYCNSLSSVLDLPALQKNAEMRIITPFDVYRRIAPQYRSFACIAANASGLEGVKRQLYHYHPTIRSIGFENLAIVTAIEAEEDPDIILARSGIREFLSVAEASSMDVLLLACTHFPYITNAVKTYCRRRNYSINVLDIDMGLEQVIRGELETVRSPIPKLSTK